MKKAEAITLTGESGLGERLHSVPSEPFYHDCAYKVCIFICCSYS